MRTRGCMLLEHGGCLAEDERLKGVRIMWRSRPLWLSARIFIGRAAWSGAVLDHADRKSSPPPAEASRSRLGVPLPARRGFPQILRWCFSLPT